MCCEICPRYTNCEEEGHLNDLCCPSCSDYGSCYSKKGSKGKGSAGPENDFDDA